MKELLVEAKELEQEIIENRRYLHQNPECGFELDNTCRFVKEKLIEYGYKPKEIYRSSIVATIGDEKRGKTIMLRADMDALPMKEESGLDYAAASDLNAAHTCGHDAHVAMLLGAAKLLKRHEDQLEGCVKLMFQPDEEGMAEDGISGAQRMIEAGVLHNPTVDAVFGLHIWSGEYKKGYVVYRPGAFMHSCDNFTINLYGKGAHGSRPHEAISAINLATQVYNGLQGLLARELPSFETGTITVGTLHSGSAANIIPETAQLTGTIRMTNEDMREKMKRRMEELVDQLAKAYGGHGEISFYNGIPCVYCQEALTKDIVSIQEEMLGKELYLETKVNSAGDDISIISQMVPTCYMMLGCGDKEEGYLYSHHNPKILFAEEVMYLGAALHANAAIEWLRRDKE